MEEKHIINYGNIAFSWRVPEYEKHERNKNWYILAICAGLLLLLFAFLSKNYLFVFFIIIAAMVIILHDNGEPDLVDIHIADEGIIVGKNFYDYDEFKNFAIVYKPGRDIKNLYFEFKSSIKQRLSIPLIDMNPLPIREKLKKNLPENLERTDLSLSESLARLFKL